MAFYDLYLPQCGEQGVMVIRKSGQADWYRRVEVRGAPYSCRPIDRPDPLWDLFDQLYPSKTSGLMAGDIVTLGPDQGVYSNGLACVARLYNKG